MGTDEVKKKKYWYHVTVHSCPICGREKTYRERRYDEKPKDYRWEWHDYYDYCQER